MTLMALSLKQAWQEVQLDTPRGVERHTQLRRLCKAVTGSDARVEELARQLAMGWQGASEGLATWLCGMCARRCVVQFSCVTCCCVRGNQHMLDPRARIATPALTLHHQEPNLASAAMRTIH